MSVSTPSRIHSIQALRGIAALGVLFFHIAAIQRQAVGKGSVDVALLSGIWDRGWAGVDLFFVISGFIMVYVTRDTGRTLSDAGRFIWARVTRIYPLWWLCAGVMMLYFWVTYGMPAAPDRVSGQSEAMAYALKSFLLLPQESPPILGLGWSLIHEMFFYIIFTGLVLLPRRFWPYALGLWAVLTIIGSAIIGMPGYARNVAELVFSPLTIEFLAGCVIGILYIRKIHMRPGLVLAVGCLAVLIGVVFYDQLAPRGYTLGRVVIFTLPFAALVYGWSVLEAQGRAKVPGFLVQIGNWSYALYLTHYIVLVAMLRIARQFLPEGAGLSLGKAGPVDNLVFAVVAIGLCLVTAALAYRLFEKPLIGFFRTRMRAQGGQKN